MDKAIIIIQGSFPGGKPYQSVIINNIENKNYSSGKLIQLIKNENHPLQRNSNGYAFRVTQNTLNFRGQGTPLPAEVLQKTESVFNTGFSDVRIHTGGKQAESIGALAFTTGNDIYFAEGQYNPHSTHGQRLLAHELTHVVQQRKGRVKNPFGKGITVINDPGLEAEAQRMGIYISKYPIQPLMKNKQSSPGKNVPANNRTIQRLNLFIGDPQKSGVDFPALAARLIEIKTGDKPKPYFTYTHPAPSFTEKIFGVTKHTLYIVTHGTPTAIIGFNTAKKLADSVKGKGLNSTNLSKIVLVACATGASLGKDYDVFARSFAAEMGVDVYAAAKIISVDTLTTRTQGIDVVTPIRFEIDDSEVSVVEGAGLTKFTPEGEGYAPPFKI